MTAISLAHFPAHLGLGATVSAEPAFTGDMQWYDAYVNRHLSDGVEGRLVSMHTSDTSWKMWEMHPHGAELVLCTAGEMTLHQEHPNGSTTQVILRPGDYVINPPGVWHTADIAVSATAVFITAGVGTQHRQRED